LKCFLWYLLLPNEVGSSGSCPEGTPRPAGAASLWLRTLECRVARARHTTRHLFERLRAMNRRRPHLAIAHCSTQPGARQVKISAPVWLAFPAGEGSRKRNPVRLPAACVGVSAPQAVCCYFCTPPDTLGVPRPTEIRPRCGHTRRMEEDTVQPFPPPWSDPKHGEK
jgi:hypothetical protein